MLHIKFCGNQPTGSGEDCGRVFTIYGRGRYLGHVTKKSRTKFQFQYPRRLLIKFQLDRPRVSKKIFKIVTSF